MSRTERAGMIIGNAEPVPVIKIEIEPAGYRKDGQLWNVYFRGSLLLTHRDPEHSAARALLALGLRGTLHVFHRGSDACSMKVDIEKAAAKRVSESGSEGPILRPYREWGRPGRTFRPSGSKKRR